MCHRPRERGHRLDLDLLRSLIKIILLFVVVVFFATASRKVFSAHSCNYSDGSFIRSLIQVEMLQTIKLTILIILTRADLPQRYNQLR